MSRKKDSTDSKIIHSYLIINLLTERCKIPCEQIASFLEESTQFVHDVVNEKDNLTSSQLNKLAKGIRTKSQVLIWKAFSSKDQVSKPSDKKKREIIESELRTIIGAEAWDVFDDLLKGKTNGM